MLTELRQGATDKFCYYLGQSTCLTLSKLGSDMIASPVALTTIGVLGLTTAVLVYRNWKPTIVTEKTPQLNSIETLKKAHLPAQEEEKTPPLPGPAAAEPILDKELSKPVSQCTAIYQMHECMIIDDKPNYLTSWIKDNAPYLLGDLTMEDGSKIPLEPGDYLVMLELNNHISSTMRPFEPHYLPSKLLKQLDSDHPLKLRYKNTPIEIVISPSLSAMIPQILRPMENEYFAKKDGYSSEPAPVIRGGVLGGLKVDTSGKKSYPHPSAVAIKASNESALETFKVQLEEALQSTDGITCFRFSQGKQQFEELAPELLDFTGLKNTNSLEIAARHPSQDNIIIEVVGADRGELNLAFWGNYFLIYYKRTEVNEFELFNDFEVTAYLTDLKELGISPEVIKANLANAVHHLQHGLLVIPTK